MGMTGANEDDRRKRRPAAAGGASAPKSQTGNPPLERLTIASDFSASREIQKKIVESAVRAGYNSQCAFAIKLALEEAMINAIKHGNRLDPSKSVHLAWRITPERAEIFIEDEGTGFDRQGVPDPTADENIEKCSGRGILLIEAYMNSVAYDRGGRRVRMVKLNEPDVLPRRNG